MTPTVSSEPVAIRTTPPDGSVGPQASHQRRRRRAEVFIELLDPSRNFNFRHFRMRHMVAELLRAGLPPGTSARVHLSLRL